MFKQRKLPVLVARRLEIDQGLYDVGPDRHQSQVELRIRSFGQLRSGSAVCLEFLSMTRGGSIPGRSTARRATRFVIGSKWRKLLWWWINSG